MLSEEKQRAILRIWDTYIENNRQVVDVRGRIINDIDSQRVSAIEDIKKMVSDLMVGKVNLGEFKTSLDGYNKRNNLWGFPAAKGQMFFNQLVNSSEHNLPALLTILKNCIAKPTNLEDAMRKLDQLEQHVQKLYTAAVDKRRVPNPGSVGYFLSYFWQIHDYLKWPIIYTSLTNSFADLEMWRDHDKQSAAYEDFFSLNEEIKLLLSAHTKSDVSNWDVEHAFWLQKGNPRSVVEKQQPKNTRAQVAVADVGNQIPQLRASFELYDYLIPRVAGLVELGSESEKSKASQFEKLVAEIFGLLDFDVKFLGKGSGRNPDAVLRFREENTAFIVDAKAYRDGYSMGIDDRAIREYIGHHCPQLQKEGYKKIGFIIVSNSFKSNLESFINEITWNTDIKRFILLTSEALLYLLAYKMKDKRNLPTIVERLVSMGNLVTASNVIEKFDDI